MDRRRLLSLLLYSVVAGVCVYSCAHGQVMDLYNERGFIYITDELVHIRDSSDTTVYDLVIINRDTISGKVLLYVVEIYLQAQGLFWISPRQDVAYFDLVFDQGLAHRCRRLKTYEIKKIRR